MFTSLHRSHIANPLLPPLHYQVCSFDNRGFGQSSDASLLSSLVDSRKRHTATNYAHDMFALLRHLEWILPLQSCGGRLPPVVHLVGWSMGGMVLQELALRLVAQDARRDFAQRVASMVLVSSSPGGLSWSRPLTLLDNANPLAAIAELVRGRQQEQQQQQAAGAGPGAGAGGAGGGDGDGDSASWSARLRAFGAWLVARRALQLRLPVLNSLPPWQGVLRIVQVG